MKHRSKPPKQLSFASYEFAQKKRVTRREKFLSEMEQVVPWGRLEALIEPKYPSAERRARGASAFGSGAQARQDQGNA